MSMLRKSLASRLQICTVLLVVFAFVSLPGCAKSAPSPAVPPRSKSTEHPRWKEIYLLHPRYLSSLEYFRHEGFTDAEVLAAINCCPSFSGGDYDPIWHIRTTNYLLALPRSVARGSLERYYDISERVTPSDATRIQYREDRAVSAFALCLEPQGAKAFFTEMQSTFWSYYDFKQGDLLPITMCDGVPICLAYDWMPSKVPAKLRVVIKSHLLGSVLREASLQPGGAFNKSTERLYRAIEESATVLDSEGGTKRAMISHLVGVLRKQIGRVYSHVGVGGDRLADVPVLRWEGERQRFVCQQ